MANSSKRALHIGIFGTFDVQNYGDLLFPLIAQAELTRRLGEVSLHPFSYNSKSPDEWPYKVNSLLDLPARMPHLDGVLIGGGDVIRFDKQVAPDYLPPAGIHHPTGFWLWPQLLALQHQVPIAWNAPGVWRGVPSWARSLMKLSLEGSDYLSVRDGASRETLAPLAPEREIHVVPDSAWSLSQLVDAQAPSETFNRLRREHGLSSPYIVVQAAPELQGFVRWVRRQSRAFRGYRIVVLPIGSVFGESARVFVDETPAMVRLEAGLEPLVIAEIISQASATVALSLHLSISARAFGVPVFRPSFAFHDKYSALNGCAGVHAFDEPRSIHPRLFVDAPGNSTQMAKRLERLAKHWDDIAATFGASTKSSWRQPALERFRATEPEFFQGDWDRNYAATLDERAPREAEPVVESSRAASRVSSIRGKLRRVLLPGRSWN